MNLSGDLSDWPVADLLNMLKVTSKTATLQIQSDRTGTVHFTSGRVAGAAISGDSVVEGEAGSRVATVDALFVLSSFDSGKFELGSYTGPEGADGWEIDDLLADMERLNELVTDLGGSELATGSLMLKDEISAPVTIVEEDWWALASLVSVLSLEQLEGVFGKARAVRLLHTLWRLGIIDVLPSDAPVAEPTSTSNDEVAAPADEAWLDEIASKQASPAAETSVAVELDDDRKKVTGVAAPASTVLTGSVLDEMRRLRSRVGE